MMYSEDEGSGGGGGKPCSDYSLKYGATTVPVLRFEKGVCGGCKDAIRQSFNLILTTAMAAAFKTFEDYIKSQDLGIKVKMVTETEMADALEGVIPTEILEELRKHG